MVEDSTKNDPKKKFFFKKKYIYIYIIQNKIVSKTMRYPGTQISEISADFSPKFRFFGVGGKEIHVKKSFEKKS